jgi:hypothetical protein
VAGVAPISGEALLQKRGAPAADSAGQARNGPVHPAASELRTTKRPGAWKGDSEANRRSVLVHRRDAPFDAAIPRRGLASRARITAVGSI